MNRYLTVVYKLPEGFDASTLTEHEYMSACAWSHMMDERDRIAEEKAELQTRWIKRLCGVMQPYTQDAIHRANYEDLMAILIEMLYEMDNRP